MRMDPKARALETCLQRLRAGESLEEALELYPQWAEELRPLLEAAQAARAFSASMLPPAGVEERSKDLFLDTASERARTRRGRWSPAGPRRFSLAPLALILVLLAGTVGTVGVSAQALPGDALYPVKIAAERTRLLLANSPARRLELEQSFDQERVGEVETLIERSLSRQVSFAGGLMSMQPGEWRVGDLRVLLPDDAQVIGQIQQGIYVDVQGSVGKDGVVVASRVQAREFQVEGKLLQRQPGQWVVDGVTLLMTPDTVVQGTPVVGSLVRMQAFLLLDHSLQARLVEVIAAPAVVASPATQDPVNETNTPRQLSNATAPATATMEPPATAEPDNSSERARPTKPPDTESHEGGQNTPEIREQKDTPEPPADGEHIKTPEPTREDDHEDGPKATEGHDDDDHDGTPPP